MLSASTAFALFEKAEPSKDDVTALRAQVAEMQGKIAVLEQKLTQQEAASLDPLAGPAVAVQDQDPFTMMDAMEQRIQALFGTYGFGSSSMPAGRTYGGGFSPDYDIKETDKTYVLTFDMPGMDKSRINKEPVQKKEAAQKVEVK